MNLNDKCICGHRLGVHNMDNTGCWGVVKYGEQDNYSRFGCNCRGFKPLPRPTLLEKIKQVSKQIKVWLQTL